MLDGMHEWHIKVIWLLNPDFAFSLLCHVTLRQFQGLFKTIKSEDSEHRQFYVPYILMC